MILIIFVIFNLKAYPFASKALNYLETISLITSTITIYCGLFYISDASNLDTNTESNIKHSNDCNL